MINGGWKVYFGLENNCKVINLWLCDVNKFLFETLVIDVILYGCEVWGCNIFRALLRRIKQIQKHFITDNFKTKNIHSIMFYS